MFDSLIGILVFIIYILNIVFVSVNSPVIPFYNIIFALSGLLIAVLGIIIWILGFITLRGSFAIAPKAKKLIKTGIYAHLRHPIYNGIVLTFLGLGLAKGSLISLLFTIFILYPFLKYRSRLEETTLLKKFGKEYKNYLNCTSSLFIAVLLFFISSTTVFSYNIPSPNNRFGIHILFPEELEKAAKLVNSNGDWGYVTIPIQSYDHDLLKWQKFMDDSKILHVIPIIRIATYSQGSFWTKPATFDSLDWPNFLNSLNWPTKDKLVILYNETNHANEWGGSVNPEEYAIHVNNIIDQFKKRDPNFVLLNGALDLSTPNDAFIYFRRMNNAVPEIFKKFDGWASHSYPQPGFSGNPYEKGLKTILGYKEELAYLENNFGVENIPVFITETGWKNTYLSQNEIADFYKKAFTEIWTEPNIIAVTPFLLSAGDGGFEGFSFLAPNGEELSSYKAVANLPKPKGNPVLSENPSVLGESKISESPTLIIQNLKPSFLNLENIKNFVIWLAHLQL